MKSIFSMITAVAIGLLSAAADAQTYPNRPIRLIVPVAVGGPTDQAARAVARYLQQTLGQPIVVENKVGGSGAIAAEYVAKSAPDGYTWLMTTSGPASILPHLRKLTFDPMKDFTPVSLVLSFPIVITVNSASPANSLGDLLKIARSGRTVTAAHSGNGGPTHLTLALLNFMAKTNAVLVPYAGDAPVVTALLGGHVDMASSTYFAAKPHIDSGRLKVLSTTGAQRAGALPDVPTVAEAASLPGYRGSTFIGLVVPAGTPADIVRRLNTEVVTYLKTEEFKKLFPVDDIIASTPTEFAAFLLQENERNALLIKSAEIKDGN